MRSRPPSIESQRARSIGVSSVGVGPAAVAGDHSDSSSPGPATEYSCLLFPGITLDTCMAEVLPHVSTDQVAAFVEVSRQGQIRSTAAVLGITEQGVRNRLLTLEAQLGVELYRKSPRAESFDRAH